MECPYCGEELLHHDSYGLFFTHQSGKKFGDIFKCPNADGFYYEGTAREYDPDFVGNWEEIVCDSAAHSAPGSFYTDKGGNLHNGYPC